MVAGVTRQASRISAFTYVGGDLVHIHLYLSGDDLLRWEQCKRYIEHVNQAAGVAAPINNREVFRQIMRAVSGCPEILADPDGPQVRRRRRRAARTSPKSTESNGAGPQLPEDA